MEIGTSSGSTAPSGTSVLFLGSQALAHPVVDLGHQLRVLDEERLHVLPALAELLTLVGEPGARLLDEPEVDRDVEERALAADALAVHDVELGLLEGGRALVLDHLDPGPVADHVGPVLDRLDPADVQPDRRVELQRPATRRGLGRPEHDADLLPQLVDEDGDGAGLRQRPGQLAQRLGHEARLQADVGVAHLAFDLGPRRQRRHRVDDQDVERAGADQHVGDLERLLAGVRLRDQEVVDVDPDGPGVDRVHGVLGVDVGADAAVALRLGHRVHGQGRLPRRLGAVDLHDAPPGQPADAQRQVQGERTGGDGLDVHPEVVAHAHDRALAELLLDLPQRGVQCLFPFCFGHPSLLFAGTRVVRSRDLWSSSACCLGPWCDLCRPLGPCGDPTVGV